MNREEIFYLLPYLFSLALSLGIFIYTWRHRYVHGARAYAWFAGGQIVTIIGFILELTSPNLQTKILWDKFQWLTDSFLIILPFLIFSLQYSEQNLRRPRLIWSYWLSVPILFTLALLTDDIHHLVYPNPHLSTDFPFPDLQYDFTFLVYVYLLLYLYGANLFGISLLVRRAIQPYNAYRLQYWTIIVGYLIPFLFTIFALFGIRIAPQRDISPFSLAIGNLVVAWGLFRYGLFDIVPIAREHIVENMTDPVVVLDVNNRVVDINPAAIISLGKQNAKVIGRLFNDVFANWPITVGDLNHPEVKKKEIAIKEDDDTFFYDLIISPIYNKRGQLLGRIIVARDVTRHKTLETGYRTLSAELEERVAERTRELQQTAERFRALFEQTNDAIFILDLEGNHLDANQRAADMLGYTREELLGLSAREVSAEISQSEQVLDRLMNGEQIPVYERFFRKNDGTVIPVEINLELVRDPNGKPLHIQSAVRDISERKQADEELRRSAERYRAVVENQTEFILRWKSDGTRTFVNEAYCRYWGLTVQEALAVSFFSHIAEEDRAAVREKISRLLSRATKAETETHRIVKPDGTIAWQEWTDQAIRDDTGNVVEFLSVGRDITKRIEAEEQLHETAERYRAVVENQTEFIVRWKPDRTRTFVNEAYCRHFGFTPEQALQTDFMTLIAEEDRQTVQEKIMRLISNVSDVETEIHQVINPDGSIGWQEWTDHAIRDETGAVIEFQSVGRDITKRKKAEDEVRKLSRAVEQSNASIVITDNTGRIEYVNPYFSELTGYTLEEAIGQNPNILKSGNTGLDVYDDLWKTITNGGEWRGEFCNRKKNGELYWESASISPIMDNAGIITHFVAVKTDITERRQALEDIRKAETQFRTLVEQIPPIVYMSGVDQHIGVTYISPRIAMLGFTQEEWIADPKFWFRQIHPDDQKKVLADIQKSIDSGAPFKSEYRLVARDGSVKWFLDEAMDVPDASGKPSFRQGLMLDITERKQADEMILNQLAFDELLTNILTHFATCSYNEVDTSITDALQQSAEFFGGDFADIFQLSEDRKSWNSTHYWMSHQLLQAGKPALSIPVGTLKWSESELSRGNPVRINTLDEYPPEASLDRKFSEEEGIKSLVSVPIKGREQSMTGVIDIISYTQQIGYTDTDITHLKLVGDAIANLLERRKAETALQKSEQKHRLLFEAANDGIFIMKDDRFIDCNSKTLEMFGCERSEIIGRNPADFSPDTQPDGGNSNEKAFEKINAVLNGKPQFFEWKHCRLDKTPFDAEVSLSLLDMDNETFIQAIVRDISERKLAEKKLAEAYDTTLEGWAKALELRDKETEGHSRRVTETTVSVARALGIPEDELVHVRRGSILHDIGKMGIPDEILRKRGPLTDSERTVVVKHPITAYNLLKPIAYLDKALDIPYCHHEKWDGSGYPRGLKGEEIPLAARIFAIVDVCDALSSDRPYREAWRQEEVAKYIADESGKHFDPMVASKFLEMMEKGGI